MMNVSDNGNSWMNHSNDYYGYFNGYEFKTTRYQFESLFEFIPSFDSFTELQVIIAFIHVYIKMKKVLCQYH